MPIDSFKDGWNTFLNNYSGYLGSSKDQSYIDNVAREIEKTEKELKPNNMANQAFSHKAFLYAQNMKPR